MLDYILQQTIQVHPQLCMLCEGAGIMHTSERAVIISANIIHTDSFLRTLSTNCSGHFRRTCTVVPVYVMWFEVLWGLEWSVEQSEKISMWRCSRKSRTHFFSFFRYSLTSNAERHLAPAAPPALAAQASLVQIRFMSDFIHPAREITI